MPSRHTPGYSYSIPVAFTSDIAIDTLLNFQSKKVPGGAGSISTKQMEDKVDAVYKEFDQRRKAYEALEADKEETEELKRLESEIKSRKNK